MAFNSGLEIDGIGNLYAHGGYADTDGRYRFFYRSPTHSSLTNVDTLPAGYTPFLDGAQTDYSLVAGLKGSTKSDLNFDISIGTGKNELSYFLNNTVNPGLVQNGDPGQRDFDMGGYEQQETNINADFAMPITDLVYLGFGLEWREETFTTVAGESAALVSPGTSGLSAVSPADAGEFSRDNYALYADAEYDVSDDLLLQAAIRYEDFSDFGSTVNGKLAARFNPTDDIVLRGSISTGFHAPTPGQANVSTIITTFDGRTGLQVEEGLLPTNAPLARENGATDLKEEESTSISFGFSYAGFDDSNIAIDFYKTEVDDRIYRTGDIETAGGNTISFFTNALDVEHQGFDLVYTNSQQWSEQARTQFTLAYNYNTIDVVDQASINGIMPVSEAVLEDIENNYPETRFVATAVTDLYDNYQLMLRANYYGSHYDERGRIGAEESPTAEIDPITFIDMEVSYFASDALTLTLGASNIFDTYVDEIGEPYANRLSVGLPYPRRTPANYEGGSWYLRAKYKF